MDQYLSTVIIAIITGVFSLITLLIQRKQEKVITKIDETTKFIEKEKELKQKLTQKEKEKEELIHQIMLLILDTNLSILRNNGVGNDIDPKVFETSDELENQFNQLNEEIQKINTEYQMVLDITSEIHRNNDNPNT